MNQRVRKTMKKTKRSEGIRLPMTNLALTEFLNLFVLSYFIIFEVSAI